MKRGEVWRVQLPPAAGHAQAGNRPAILIQGDTYTAQLPTVVVVPLTGTLAAARFPGTLVIQPDGQNGLTIPSVALVFQARAVDKRDLLLQLGQLHQATLGQVAALLIALTGWAIVLLLLERQRTRNSGDESPRSRAVREAGQRGTVEGGELACWRVAHQTTPLGATDRHPTPSPVGATRQVIWRVVATKRHAPQPGRPRSPSAGGTELPNACAIA